VWYLRDVWPGHCWPPLHSSKGVNDDHTPPFRPLTSTGTAPNLNDNRGWHLLALTAILFVAFLVRIWDVGHRAMHIDEATVGWSAWQFLTGHGYAYDPVYHGPFQHEFLAGMLGLFQSSETSVRLLAVITGTALVVLPWFIRDYVGRGRALLAAFLLAVSPSMVYFSRFERDDMYMEFFTFLAIVLIVRFLRDRRPWQIYGLVLSAALAFATKESIYIVFFLAVLFGCTWLVGRRLRRRVDVLRPMRSPRNRVLVGGVLLAGLVLAVVTGLALPAVALIAVALLWTVAGAAAIAPETDAIRSYIGPLKRHWINALTIALGVEVLMYATLGTNLNGLWDHAHPFFLSARTLPSPSTAFGCAWDAGSGRYTQTPYSLPLHLNSCRKDIIGGLLYWLSQHQVARGGQPWYYYLLIYGLYEQIALLLGIAMALRTFLSPPTDRHEHQLRAFLTYWAIGSLVIYCWAGEKFPWLGIHPLLPLTLLAAVAIEDLYQAAVRARLPIWRKDRNVGGTVGLVIRRVCAGLTLCVCGALLVFEVHNTYLVNFVDDANPKEMMVYGQSAQDTPTEAATVMRLSRLRTEGPNLRVAIDAPDWWPFAWYLRTMPRAAYIQPADLTTAPYDTYPVLIVAEADASSLPKSISSHYARHLFRLDWWGPEAYKDWDLHTIGQDIVSPNSWQAIMSWELDRQAFGDNVSDWYYVYIRTGYFHAY
jgi:uncharacterized protein (TIGR03663 family)